MLDSPSYLANGHKTQTQQPHENEMKAIRDITALPQQQMNRFIHNRSCCRC